MVALDDEHPPTRTEHVMTAHPEPVTPRGVLGVLNEIVDPCSLHSGAPAGLVDMGLVSNLKVIESRHGTEVACQIGVTEMGCFMAAPFVNEARERLRAMPGVTAVTVEVDPDIHWSPERMDTDYRKRLEAARQERRVLLGMPGGAPLSRMEYKNE